MWTHRRYFLRQASQAFSKLPCLLSWHTQVKSSASSLATRATVIRALGSPWSSFFLHSRCLVSQLPSGGSSAQLRGTMQSPCASLYVTSRAMSDKMMDHIKSY
jgi:hypothetical protein